MISIVHYFPFHPQIQSLIWMGLSITAIVAYYCNLDFDGVTATMGSITGLTLFQLYFRGWLLI